VASGGCTIGCGPDDVYRLRLYETTGRMTRFNNSASQVTVVLLHNRSAAAVEGTLWFWSGGSLLSARPFQLAPRASLVLNSATIPALTGQAGAITVSHDGAYGALAGKAVALEPATGFSFDTPMEYRAK
jgi:hypothetical protein